MATWSLEPLRASLEQFIEKGEWQEWGNLSTHGLMHRSLQDTVRAISQLDEEVAAHELGLLEECWQVLSDKSAQHRIAAYYSLHQKGIHQGPDVERLHENSRLLLATAGAAIGALRAAHNSEREGSLHDLHEWAVRAVFLDSSVDAKLPSSLQYQNPVQIAEDVYNALADQSRRTATANCWTRLWLSEGLRAAGSHGAESDLDVMRQKLDEAVTPASAVTVPVAGYDHARKTGFIACLELRLLKQPGGGLIEDPEGSILWFLAANLLNVIKAAARKYAVASASIFWSLELPQEASAGLQLEGESLGGAAEAGFLLLRQQQPFNRRCLIMATVGDGGILGHVEREREKLDAALRERIRLVIVPPDTRLTRSPVAGIRVEKAKTLAETVELARGLPDSTKPLTPHELHDIFGERVWKRVPVWPASVREIEKRALEVMANRRKVVILGEPEIGKTTLLYWICRSLIVRGQRLYEFDPDMEGVRPGDVLFRDNINPDQARSLSRQPNAAIATCRPENWNASQAQGWQALWLLRQHFPREALREILLDCLSAKGVQPTEEGIEEAVSKCQGLPGYLEELAFSCQGKTLAKEIAQTAPAESIGIIQEELSSLNDDKALKLLFALALSKRSRLHEIQLQALVHDRSLPEKFRSLTVKEPGSVYVLGHDLWRDVLLRDWSLLGQAGSKEPDALERIRKEAHSIAAHLKDLFRDSIPSLLKLTGIDAAAAARVALENQASILPDLHQSIMDSGFDKAHLASVLELLAVTDPHAIREHHRRSLQDAGGGAEGGVVFLLYWAETLGFKSDSYLVSESEDGEKRIFPRLPAYPEFIAPAYQALVLEEAASLLSDDPERLIGDPDIRARLYSDLGSVKRILGDHEESLRALGLAVDECLRACRSEEGILKGYPIKLHDTLDKLGECLLEAGHHEEAVQCLSAAVRTTRLIWDSWLIFMKVTNAEVEGNGTITMSEGAAEELSRLASVFKEMGDSSSLIQKENIDVPPDFNDPDAAFIGPIDSIKALASSLGHLAQALRRVGKSTEGHRAQMAASQFNNRIASFYRKEENLPALAEALVEMRRGLAAASANQVLLQALDIYRKLAVDEDAFLPKVARTLDRLGCLAASDLGEPERATSYWREAEEILQTLALIHPRFIVDHSRVAGSLARLLLERKDVIPAIDYLDRARTSLENAPSSDVDSKTLKAQISELLGDAYLFLERWDKAIEHFRRSELEWVELGATDGESLMSRAEAMVGLGTAFLIGKKQPELALEPLSTAIQFLRRIDEPSDRQKGSLAGTFDRLGSAQADNGDLKGALESYLEAQAIFRQLPTDKPWNAVNLGRSLCNIGRLRAEMGQGEEAQNNLREAEQICQPFLESSGIPNKEIAFLLANLGGTYKQFGINERSAICYRNALEQLQRLTKGDRRFGQSWAQVLNDYGKGLSSDQRIEDGVTVYRESSDFLKGLNDPSEGIQADLALTLANLGEWLDAAGRTEEAIAAYEESDGLLSRLSEVSEKYVPHRDQVRQRLRKAKACQLSAERN